MSGGGTKRRASSEGAPVKRVKFLEDETNSPKRLPGILSSPIQVPSPSTLPEPVPPGSETPLNREKLRKPPSGDPIYPRDSDSPNPIPKTLVPEINQFLAFDYSKRAGANKIDLLSEDCPPSLAASDPPTRPTRSTTASIPITTAGAMQFFDTKLAVAGEKNVWRDLVYLLAIRYHHITTDDVVLKALPVRLQQQPAVRQAELVTLIKDFDQLQTSVQSWHYAGIKRTINMMGLKRWRSSTTPERRKVFEAIWAQDPLEMARGSLGLAKQVVPIGIIWSGDSEIHRKWQSFHKTMFFWTCEDIYRYRLRTPNDRRLDNLKSWKCSPLRPVLEQLHLGDADEIPVSYSIGTRKRVMPRAPSPSDDYALADDEEE